MTGANGTPTGSGRGRAPRRRRSPNCIESCFEPLDDRRCAELLHGERGFWVSDFIDSADPPPAYGRFAHVRLDVLTERVAGLIGSTAAPV